MLCKQIPTLSQHIQHKKLCTVIRIVFLQNKHDDMLTTVNFFQRNHLLHAPKYKNTCTGVLEHAPDVCFIVPNAAAINFFNFLVESAQHFLLIICFELPKRKHPTTCISNCSFLQYSNQANQANHVSNHTGTYLLNTHTYLISHLTDSLMLACKMSQCATGNDDEHRRIFTQTIITQRLCS